MYNNQPIENRALAPRAPCPAPAQTPTEFAQSTFRQANEINDRLANLRYRLFGDLDERPPNSESKEMSLEALIQATHLSLNETLGQIEGIQGRL